MRKTELVQLRCKSALGKESHEVKEGARTEENEEVIQNIKEVEDQRDEIIWTNQDEDGHSSED